MPKKFRNFAPYERRVVTAVRPEKSDGRTQGQYKNECDINVVVSTYRRSDDPFPLQRAFGSPMYANLPDQTDLHSALNMVADASTAFNALPSHIRERYKNNAAEFVGALSNPSERDFLLDSGVLEAHQLPERPSDRVKKILAPTGPKNAPDNGAS